MQHVYRRFNCDTLASLATTLVETVPMAIMLLILTLAIVTTGAIVSIGANDGDLGRDIAISMASMEINDEHHEWYQW